jgi:hypothetical protein
MHPGKPVTERGLAALHNSTAPQGGPKPAGFTLPLPFILFPAMVRRSALLAYNSFLLSDLLYVQPAGFLIVELLTKNL